LITWTTLAKDRLLSLVGAGAKTSLAVSRSEVEYQNLFNMNGRFFGPITNFFVVMY
jgi:hypothetical protein